MKRSVCGCLVVVGCFFSLIVINSCGGENGNDSRANSSPADDDDDDDNAADDDDLADDDDTIADDDDNDNDDEVPPPLCGFTACSSLTSRVPIAQGMLAAGETYCGSVNPDLTFAELLRVDDLLAQRSAIQVMVHINEETDLGTSIRRELVFDDPAIGSFLVYTYLPTAGEPPYPTVLLTHGHGSWALDFFNLVGAPLINAGFLVVSQQVKGLTPNPSKNGWHTWYEMITYRLAPFDRTAYGTMVYQTAIVLDYLDTLGDVDPSRIVAMGHSGGSFLSVNMLAVDDRLKGAVGDYYRAFPEASSGYDLNVPFEEIIPGLFCWGGGERIQELTAGHFNLQYSYGYPDDSLAQVITKLHDLFALEASCGDGVCGPGDTDINCPTDCHDPGNPASFTFTTQPIPYDYMDLDILVSLAGQKYWDEAPPFTADQVVSRLREHFSLDRMEARLNCLPNSISDEEGNFADYLFLSRQFCFGEAGLVVSRLYFPGSPDDLSQAAGLVVFLTGPHTYDTSLDEEELKRLLLSGGLAVLEIDLPLIDQSTENSIEGYNLLAYGLPSSSFYLWQIREILSSTRVEFGCNKLPVYVYGNEPGALLSIWLTILDERIAKTAAGLLWPVWQDDVATPQNVNLLSVADYFSDQAVVGSRDDILDLIDTSDVFLFPRLTVAASTIANFYINP